MRAAPRHILSDVAAPAEEYSLRVTSRALLPDAAIIGVAI